MISNLLSTLQMPPFLFFGWCTSPEVNIEPNIHGHRRPVRSEADWWTQIHMEMPRIGGLKKSDLT